MRVLPLSVLGLGINWATISARASHFGGLWEAAITSMKLHFQKIVGKVTRLQLEEMYTITCHIEAIMNSRPITFIPNDALDKCPLTPSMLLTGFKRDYLPIVADVQDMKPDELFPSKDSTICSRWFNILGKNGRKNILQNSKYVKRTTKIVTICKKVM